MWEELNNKLCIHLEFKDFAEAMGFVNEVSLKAEMINHHPTWTNTWNKVDIVLCTHDAGDKITEKDKKLAKMIDDILIKYHLNKPE
jgi:4a-hydroxytetrahydrobiopterin dehydratase